MGDNIIRHLVALAATIICLLSFYAGYIAGPRGWWWAAFSALIIYGGIYKLVNK
ncbi:MAG: hypothetical protein US58_C0007G0016 [Candidatus Magasanikbacteria bacterium GW2011_GWA2_37_8]|uniref:Uncharacterized protein n=1 Tax=Candidatus Magasanikbacteria bacterium GW2011_GWA2_37_8 TaxID=1619036 RepID=A0A0G0HQV5_9BACT|nr:MAG: hypothetical protein US58_C0007G0016 [Candidatus Magasanikbacteria bacterium GW2011_GWA2_37_8]